MEKAYRLKRREFLEDDEFVSEFVIAIVEDSSVIPIEDLSDGGRVTVRINLGDGDNVAALGF
ncbi:MAG: hypothetical protein DWQ47_01840 [Acidobacteria bacterium]|nr:MAG: hypothetical protein DWQ32_05390 [Acidobacteriota bacterium]REK01165.1 MAG: hypothetical protein DWQ38_01825 [Acidobacteriota bacterium]REK14121.1 MAG: hypothetical protein DWQ43_11080 [Acidobacteriota bacterium]REK44836.1 MAG: hypothetical protein DWQ47_01840 [Acidobacteriota bacterium]